jgi:hypothetical protein
LAGLLNVKQQVKRRSKAQESALKMRAHYAGIKMRKSFGIA